MQTTSTRGTTATSQSHIQRASPRRQRHHVKQDGNGLNRFGRTLLYGLVGTHVWREVQGRPGAAASLGIPAAQPTGPVAQPSPAAAIPTLPAPAPIPGMPTALALRSGLPDINQTAIARHAAQQGSAAAPLPLQLGDANDNITVLPRQGEPAGNGDASFAYSTEEPSASLFGEDGEPSLDEVRQGSFIGDCYFNAVIGALSVTVPDYLKKVIQYDRNEQGARIYRLLMYHDSKPLWVEVSDAFLRNSQGRELGNDIANDGSIGYWAALMEKAWVSFTDAYPDVMNNPLSGYNGITSGDPGVVFRAVANAPPTYVDVTKSDAATIFANVAGVANHSSMAVLGTTDPAMLTRRPGWHADSQSLTLGDGTIVSDNGDGTMNFQAPDGSTYTIVRSHAYIIIQVDAAGGRLQMHNPWNIGVYQTDRTFWAPIELAQNLGTFAVITGRPGTLPPIPNPPPEPGADHGGGLSPAAIGVIAGLSVAAVAGIAALLTTWKLRICCFAEQP